MLVFGINGNITKTHYIQRFKHAWNKGNIIERRREFQAEKVYTSFIEKPRIHGGRAAKDPTTVFCCWVRTPGKSFDERTKLLESNRRPPSRESFSSTTTSLNPHSLYCWFELKRLEGAPPTYRPQQWPVRQNAANKRGMKCAARFVPHEKAWGHVSLMIFNWEYGVNLHLLYYI